MSEVPNVVPRTVSLTVTKVLLYPESRMVGIVSLSRSTVINTVIEG